MSWSVPRMWDGGDVWIIGGGPSIPRQFDVPEAVIQKVIAGELPLTAYSPYMQAIHGKHVIGINIAYMIGPWIDMVFFGDNNFFLSRQQALADFPGLKVSCAPVTHKHSWVKYLPREGRKSRGISSNPGMVSWNGNSGSAAISVAAHAGAKRIILLGFDMNLSKDHRQHWHDVYKKGVYLPNDPKRLKKLPFSRHLMGFPKIAEDARRMGIEILNASPDSAIQNFTKVKVKDLL